MLAVRTDLKAVLTGSAIIALFTLQALYTGLVVPSGPGHSVDIWLVLGLASAAGFGVPFLIMHDQLRRRGVRAREAYAAIGAAAALPQFLLAAGQSAVLGSLNDGRFSALLACPLIAGALVGFLYHRRAGFDVEGDDVDALEVAAAPPSEDLFAPATPPGAHITTRTAEYFDGPLVVRNSLGANALASIAAAAAFVMAGTFSAWADPVSSPMSEFMAHNGAGRTALQAIIGMTLPIGLLLAMTHGYLRGRGKFSYRDYAKAGAIGPAIFSLLIAMTGMSIIALAYMVQFLAPSLIAMLAYRRLAGLEPAPLPDDIEVNDRRTLVGKDHVRRRMARVINTSAPANINRAMQAPPTFGRRY